MKGLSAITLAVAVTVSTTAFAAKSKVKAVDAGATSASLAPAAATSNPSAMSASGTGAIAAPAPTASEKNWSVDLFAINYYDVVAAEQGKGKMEALSYAGFNRKLSNGKKVFLRQWFSGDISNETSIDSKYRVDDTELGLGLGKLAKWNNGGISLTNRLSLPTGKMSRAMGKTAGIRLDLSTSHEIGKNLEVGHLLSPRVSIQSRDRWTNPEDGKTKETGLAKLFQYGYVTAKANDKLSATVALGTIETISKRSGTRGSNSYLDISTTAQLTKQLELSLGVDSEPNQGAKQGKRHAFLRNDETQYYMSLSATL